MLVEFNNIQLSARATIKQIIKNSGAEGYKDNIYGFLKFLENFIFELELLTIDLITNLKSIIPFKKGESGIPNWWHTYNDVKHDEPNKYQQGNLENALTGLAALKLVHYNICRSIESKIFVNLGIPVPPEYMERRFLLFPDEYYYVHREVEEGVGEAMKLHLLHSRR